VTLYRSAWGKLRATDPQAWAGGLSMPQIRVLFFLNRAGPSAVGEVAAGVEVSQPSATETLDRLVRAGLVKRKVDAADRRVVRKPCATCRRRVGRRSSTGSSCSAAPSKWHRGSRSSGKTSGSGSEKES